MSTKKLLPRAIAEKFSVSTSSPLFADGSRSLERLFSGLLFRSLGSFSSDNVRLLKLGKRFIPYDGAVDTQLARHKEWPSFGTRP